MPKIDLYLMGYRGYKCLDFIVSSGHKHLVNNVIIAGDSSLNEDYKENIISICKNFSLQYSFREDSYVNEDDNVIALAISWRWILSDKNLIIFHDSLLPRYRGFSPLVSQLINNEKILGVTALLPGAEGYDSGDILCQSEISIRHPIKIYDAIIKTTSCYIKLLSEILEKINHQATNNLEGTIQNKDLATYSLWRDNDDYLIDWSRDSQYIERFVNATGYPYLGAQTRVNDEILFVKDGQACQHDLIIENRTPGKVLFIDESRKPTVVCGKGLYKISECITQSGEDYLRKNNKFRLRFH